MSKLRVTVRVIGSFLGLAIALQTIIQSAKQLVPVFSDVDAVTQQCALSTYRELLPGREVVPVKADSLSYSGGFLHCISITVPGGVEVAARLDG